MNMILNAYLSAFKNEDEPFVFHYSFDTDKSVVETRLTRGEFLQLARQAAWALKEHGLLEGDRFALCVGGNSSFDLAFRLAAVMRAAIPVTVNWQADTTDRIQYKIELTGCKLVLTDSLFNQQQLEAVHQAFPHIPISDISEIQNKPSLPETEYISVSDPLFTRITVFTSGTTGRPKGVKLSYRSYNTNRATFEKFLNIAPEDYFAALIVNPLHHGNSTAITDWAMRRPGSRIHLVEKYTAAYWRILDEATSIGYNRLLAPTVSRHFDFLEALDRENKLQPPLNRLRNSLAKVDFLMGSAPVGPTTIKRLKRYAGRVPWVRFGSTETCLQAIGTPGHFTEEQKSAIFERGWSRRTNDEPQVGHYIGRPHPPFTDAKIVKSVDPDQEGFMTDCEIGEPGYVVAKGENLMSGYFNDPAETRKAFHGEWYLGLKDICFALRNEFDGELDYYWIARDSMMLIRGGANYAYSQINAELADFISSFYNLPREYFEVATLGLKIESEHEDACCVTIETFNDEAPRRLQNGPEPFAQAASRHVTKGARPDYVRFGKIPRNFKGAVLMEELTKDFLTWLNRERDS